MTATFWLTAGQTVLFIAVCGYGHWAARLIAEAADSSALAAEQATKAANDAKSTATDIGEMQDLLREWLEQQQAQLDHLREAQAQVAAMAIGPVRTDTAEAHGILTPDAIIGRGSSMDSADRRLKDAARRGRGRHAR